LNYTWSQFVAFSEAVERCTRQRDAEQFVLMLIASRGSEDSVKETLQLLEK